MPLVYSRAFAPEAQRKLAGGETTGTARNASPALKGRQTRLGLSPLPGLERLLALISGGFTTG